MRLRPQNLRVQRVHPEAQHAGRKSDLVKGPGTLLAESGVPDSVSSSGHGWQDSGLPLLKVVRTRALTASDERGWPGSWASLAQPVGVSDLFHLSSQLISNWSSHHPGLWPELLAPLLPPFHSLKLSSQVL